MSRAASIISRLDVALRKVGPLDRTSYKRIVTRTGGDDLIGRPGTITYVDTVFDPQPQYTRLARFLVGPGAKSQDMSDASGKHRIADEYAFTFSPSAIAFTDLTNDDLMIVLKDAAGVIELFDVSDYEPISMNGLNVVYIVYAKSLQRP